MSIFPKIIFVGTAEFGGPILEKLVASQYQPKAVVTTPDKPKGRQQILTSSPIKQLADKWQIPVLQPQKIIDTEDKLAAIQPDLIIVVAYGQILPKAIFSMPKFGSLNLHGSLLPKYRGPSPIQTAILKDEKETGVTLMLIDEKIDHGGILAQKKIEISPGQTAPTLHNKLAYLAANLLIETLPLYLEGKIKPQAQDDSKATYTKILTKDDGQLDLEKSAQDLEQQIRAYVGWPGSWLIYKEKRLKILKAKAVGLPAEQALKTKNGYLLPELVQPAGKKPMSWEEFSRGVK